MLNLEYSDTKTLREQMEASLGTREADLYIHNVRILDVYTNSIFKGSILVKHGKIVGINPTFEPKAKMVFDGGGRYAVPGFIEPSMHIDCSLVMPNALCEAFVPAGTTTLVAEVNDLGGYDEAHCVENIKTYFKDIDRLPLRLLALAPGKCIPEAATYELLSWDQTYGQGENFGYTTLAMRGDTLNKLVNTRNNGIFLNGHVEPFAGPDEINLFATAGSVNDHEAWTFDAVLQRLRRGIPTQILYSQGSTQIEYLIRTLVLEHHVPTENLLFSADNAQIDELNSVGHLNNLVRLAIRYGLDPISAIKMASFNTARNLHLDHLMGSLTPGRFADIILLDNLVEIAPAYVFYKGELVSRGGRLVNPPPKVDYSSLYCTARKGLSGLTPAQLRERYRTAQDCYTARILSLKSRGGGTAENIDGSSYVQVRLPVSEGHIQCDFKEDVIKIAQIERYPQTADRKINASFVSGFNLKRGAVAMNHVPRYHTILVMGTREEDMVMAAKAVDEYPGAIVTCDDGKMADIFPLPLACMISDATGEEGGKAVSQISSRLRSWGCDLPEPLLRFFHIGFSLK